MIRSLSFGTLALIPALHSGAQEATLKWDVEIPSVVAPPVEITQPEPESISFSVLTSNTTQVEVTEPPALPGLPPVQGIINLTVETVESPELPQSFSSPLNSEIAQIEEEAPQELLENHHSSDLLFLSATVYPSGKTLLSLYPAGGDQESVTAWSNLDFKHFQGFASYQVNLPDGATEDVGLIMGIGDAHTQESGSDNLPAVPQLPDLTSDGPSFVIVEGITVGKAAERLEQLHELYRKEGTAMEAAHLAREQELAARKAALLANPPQPQDITIRYWKGETKSVGTEVAE